MESRRSIIRQTIQTGPQQILMASLEINMFTLDHAQRLHSRNRQLGVWDFYPAGEVLDGQPSLDLYPGSQHQYRYKDNTDIIWNANCIIVEQQEFNNGIVTTGRIEYEWGDSIIGESQFRTYDIVSRTWDWQDGIIINKTYQSYVWLSESNDYSRVFWAAYTDNDKSYSANSDFDKVAQAYTIKWPTEKKQFSNQRSSYNQLFEE